MVGEEKEELEGSVEWAGRVQSAECPQRTEPPPSKSCPCAHTLLLTRLLGVRSSTQAEVQSVQTDGGVALHTRSLKYGMVRGGACGPSSEQKGARQQSHHSLGPPLPLHAAAQLHAILC